MSRTAQWCLSVSLITVVTFLTQNLWADAAQDHADKLWADYQKIHSVHFKATESLEIPPSKISGGHGAYEYWVDGSKFKIADLWDPRERPGVENEIYWNGKQFLERVASGSSVAVSSQLDLVLPVADPLPLLPFRFIFPGGADEGKQVTLDQIQDPKTRDLFRKLRSLNADGSEAEYPALPYDYTHVPEAGFRSFASTYHIEFAGKPGYLPIKILRTVSSGAAWDTWEISYAIAQSKLGDLYLPSQVKYTTVAPFATNPAMRVGIFVFKVTALDLNGPIPPDIFSTDFKSAKDVIDLDRLRRSSVSGPTTQPG